MKCFDSVGSLVKRAKYLLGSHPSKFKNKNSFNTQYKHNLFDFNLNNVLIKIFPPKIIDFFDIFFLQNFYFDPKQQINFISRSTLV